jgi:hypothetical protein
MSSLQAPHMLENTAVENGVENGTRNSGQFTGKPGPGRPSKKELQVRLAAETDRLAASLDRVPTAFEHALIRQLAALNLQTPTLDTARVSSRIAKQLGIKPATDKPAAKPTIKDYAAAKKAAQS